MISTAYHFSQAIAANQLPTTFFRDFRPKPVPKPLFATALEDLPTWSPPVLHFAHFSHSHFIVHVAPIVRRIAIFEKNFVKHV
jgi:hypothetical protein